MTCCGEGILWITYNYSISRESGSRNLGKLFCCIVNFGLFLENCTKLMFFGIIKEYFRSLWPGIMTSSAHLEIWKTFRIYNTFFAFQTNGFLALMLSWILFPKYTTNLQAVTFHVSNALKEKLNDDTLRLPIFHGFLVIYWMLRNVIFIPQ